jgi:DNA repair exonuclease SbcCD nuclease subunit
MDSPFDALPEDKAALRRREQRDLLEQIVFLAEKENVQLVLLSGDLLDSSSSYFETQEALRYAFTRIKAEIFIAPGNHDYYCAKSPYAYLTFPENVHIFRSPAIECVELPNLGCRVWGAGFNTQNCRPVLTGFKADESEYTDIMVLHGDTGGDVYNHISETDIAQSGLHYLALGHIHSFSGIKRSGKTNYAYPGCPEGRGFDETGEKGVIVGHVGKIECDLHFTPLGGRAYQILQINLTGCENTMSSVINAIPQNTGRDIYRIVLTGEYDGRIDLPEITASLTSRFFNLTVINKTKPRRDIWAAAGDDTLRGIFIRNMRALYEAADTGEKEDIVLAVRYGLSALDNGEEWQA